MQQTWAAFEDAEVIRTYRLWQKPALLSLSFQSLPHFHDFRSFHAKDTNYHVKRQQISVSHLLLLTVSRSSLGGFAFKSLPLKALQPLEDYCAVTFFLPRGVKHSANSSKEVTFAHGHWARAILSAQFKAPNFSSFCSCFNQ